MKEIHRQGDVILVKVETTETEAKKVQPGQRVILAHGEVTGHTHALLLDAPAKRAPKQPVFDAAAERYIQVVSDATLRHEEHHAAILKAGKYEIGVQVEAGPPNMLRRVAD